MTMTRIIVLGMRHGLRVVEQFRIDLKTIK